MTETNKTKPELQPLPTLSPVEAQKVLRRITRDERKLAREVIKDAAQAMGMRRLEFIREVGRGNMEARAELKCSLAMHDDAGEFDIDEFGRILQMILDFLMALFAIFGGI